MIDDTVSRRKAIHRWTVHYGVAAAMTLVISVTHRVVLSSAVIDDAITCGKTPDHSCGFIALAPVVGTAAVAIVIAVISTAARCVHDDVTVRFAAIICAVMIIIIAQPSHRLATAPHEP